MCVSILGSILGGVLSVIVVLVCVIVLLIVVFVASEYAAVPVTKVAEVTIESIRPAVDLPRMPDPPRRDYPGMGVASGNTFPSPDSLRVEHEYTEQVVRYGYEMHRAATRKVDWNDPRTFDYMGVTLREYPNNEYRDSAFTSVKPGERYRVELSMTQSGRILSVKYLERLDQVGQSSADCSANV